MQLKSLLDTLTAQVVGSEVLRKSASLPTLAINKQGSLTVVGILYVYSYFQSFIKTT